MCQRRKPKPKNFGRQGRDIVGGARKRWMPNHALRNRGMRSRGVRPSPNRWARNREASNRGVRHHEWERGKISRKTCEKSIFMSSLTRHKNACDRARLAHAHLLSSFTPDKHVRKCLYATTKCDGSPPSAVSFILRVVMLMGFSEQC